MDRLAAAAMLAAIPLLFAAFWLLNSVGPPFLGFTIGMGLYWFGVLLPLIVWRWNGSRMRAMAKLRWPGRPLAIAGAAVSVATMSVAIYCGLPAWPLIIAAVVAAVINGTLEEVFWRGTLLPSPDPNQRELAIALVLFTGWHIALFAARDVDMTGGRVALIAGAAAFGLLALLIRLRTDSFATPGLVHAGFNVGAFLDLTAQNT